jgi:hypothetical protein
VASSPPGRASGELVAAADALAHVPALEAQAAAAARGRQLVGEDEHGAGHGSPGEDQEDRHPEVLAHFLWLSALARLGLTPSWRARIRLTAFSTMGSVGIFGFVLLTLAVLLVIGAEWPRLAGRLGGDGRSSRARRRRKAKLTVVEGQGDDREDFAASVERDLANLPVIEERDDRSRR